MDLVDNIFVFVKMFVCNFNECTISFKTKSGLKRHSKIHSEERLLKCTFEGCTDTFKRSDHLARHNLIHFPEKSFKCTFDKCSAAFKRSDHLENHKRIHTGERPFKCECGVAYTSKNALITHIKFFHTLEGQQQKKREEQRISEALEKAGIPFKREHFIKFDCAGGTHGRIDFVIMIKNRVIFLEVDEDQHSGYDISCDTRRMALVHECCMLEGNTLPILFIRYNPHSFKINGKLKKINKIAREQILINYIQNLGDTLMSLAIQYMFYNLKDDKLAIWDHYDYPETLKELVLANIS